MKLSQQSKEILHLAVPSIVSNITVPLLGLVDLTIVGHMGSETYIAAIAVGSMLFNILYWTMGFLRMGTSGRTSQALGRKDYAALRHEFRHALLTSSSIALGLIVLQRLVRWLAITIMGPSAVVTPLVYTYFDILIWGAPAMLGIYGLTGWSVGMQSTKIPMTVAIFQNVVNIVASLTFVYVCGMKISGVALGTLVAQWSGFLLCLWLVNKKRRSLPKVTLSSSPVGGSFAVGHDGGDSFEKFAVGPDGLTKPIDHQVRKHTDLDIFLRTLCLIVVNLFFTSSGARQGDMMLAVNTLLMTFYTLFSYVMDGFAFAAEALCGKLYGAKDYDGLHREIRAIFRWGVVMTVLFTVVYVVGGRPFLGLITSDQGVIAAAMSFYFWACLIPLCGVAAFLYDGIFIGLTATRGMLLSAFTATVSFFAIFITGAAIVGQGAAVNHFLWLAFLIYMSMRGVMQYFILQRITQSSSSANPAPHQSSSSRS